MSRPEPIFVNPAALPQIPPSSISSLAAIALPSSPDVVLNFHRTLPDYNTTPLRSLDSLASSVGVSSVLLKDESLRFGLPAFKILGASWALYRAVVDACGLSLPDLTDASSAASLPSLEELEALARKKGVKVVTATEGNWGRAMGRMARYLGVRMRVYVSDRMVERTRELIRGEGAEVEVREGGYEVFSKTMREEVRREGGWVLVEDAAWEGTEVTPLWVVEGYTTMLVEALRQTREQTGRDPTHVFVPCGGGSIAHATAQFFKSNKAEPTPKVIAVEPATAACLKNSLEHGTPTPVTTGKSIMAGLNCGEISPLAWKFLKEGTDAAVVVSERQSHEAVGQLKKGWGVSSGPCGAATLAALRIVAGEDGDEARKALGLDAESVVLLLCTEGEREYAVPE